MKVEILYTAWNRRAYTEMSFRLLAANTNWLRVSRVVIYDDGSEDGTREWLEGEGRELVGPYVPAYEVRHGGWHSTGATLNDYIAQVESDVFVKIDNDICVPPGWLERLSAVAYRNPGYELVGMEAGWTGPPKGTLPTGKYGVEPTRHIGGVGLMRVHAFGTRRPVPLSLGKNGRAGFTIWQHRHHLVAGWITPDLYVVQLDRIPEEPWASLAAEYVEQGWARTWEPYVPDMRGWWEWLPDPATVT
jgi:glycosyltransferase involved in cell wall biosynthesis